MEDSENTQYVSFIEEHRARDGGEGPSLRSSTPADISGPSAAPAAANDSSPSPSSPEMRKLIQSHRHKSRVAALVGLLAGILFSIVFLYFQSSFRVEFDQNRWGDSGGGVVDSRRHETKDGRQESEWITTPPTIFRRRGLDDDNPEEGRREGMGRRDGYGNFGGEIAGKPDDVWNWSEEQFQGAFSMWATTFEKKYDNEEERGQRYAIFRRNMMYIATHNMQGFSYTLAMNEFGDLTNDEFKKRYLGFDSAYQQKNSLGQQNYGVWPPKSDGVMHELLDPFDSDGYGSMPKSLDWRRQGCVQPVKDQGQCGSCWAFSATGSMEGAVCAQMGGRILLSEQQLVDCAQKEGNNGCGGGQMEGAFQYVINNGGLCSEQDYPYHAKDEKCKSSQCKPVIHLQAYKSVPPQNEKALQKALLKFGPVSVGIEADQMPFQFYHDGVFDGSCGSDLDHGVLAVGYGTEEGSGKDYWIVKNSWGPKWGDRGFIKLARHVGPAGQCGILLDPSFPIVSDGALPSELLPPPVLEQSVSWSMSDGLRA